MYHYSIFYISTIQNPSLTLQDKKLRHQTKIWRRRFLILCLSAQRYKFFKGLVSTITSLHTFSFGKNKNHWNNHCFLHRKFTTTNNQVSTLFFQHSHMLNSVELNFPLFTHQSSSSPVQINQIPANTPMRTQNSLFFFLNSSMKTTYTYN